MTSNLMVDVNGQVVGVITSHVSLLVGGGTQNHHALHQYRLEEAVKTEIIAVGVLTAKVVSININVYIHIFCISASYLMYLSVSDRGFM